MAKFQISKEEIKQMIKEEYSKKITEIKLKNRLHQINEEISTLTEEDELDEVKVGGKKTVVGADGISKGTGYEPVFEKKGSHLVEDDELEIDATGVDTDVDTDAGNEEDTLEINTDDDESLEGDLDIEALLAKLADAIEDKIETTVNEKLEGGEEGAEEIPSEEMTDELPGEEKPAEEMTDEVPGEEKPIDEGKGLVSESTIKRMQILSGIRRNDFND